MVDPSDNAAAIRVIAMPADTNPLGDIFGGWLTCQKMDLAASIVAARRSEGRGDGAVLRAQQTFVQAART